MSIGFALSFGAVMLLSNIACYKLGQQNILARFEEYYNKRKKELEDLNEKDTINFPQNINQ